MFPTTQNSISDLNSALANSQVQETVQSGKAFIQFDFKTGSFVFGREKEDISGDEIIVNTASFQHGWTIWANGKPNKQLVGFTEPLPIQPEPIDGNTASEARSFEARFSDDEDTILSFDTNSYGGRKGCDTLLNAIKVKATSGTEYLFPIVTLDNESYKSTQGGIIHNPVFTVVGWVNQNGEKEGGDAPSLIEQELDAAVEDAPKRRRRKVA